MKSKSLLQHLVLSSLIGLLTVSCAGPFNNVGVDNWVNARPSFVHHTQNFGIHSDQDNFILLQSKNKSAEAPLQHSPTADLSFSPSKILYGWQDKLSLKVHLLKEDKFSPHFELMVLQNGRDISHQGKIKQTSRNSLTLDFTSTLFSKNKDYKITALFRNHPKDEWNYIVLDEIQCDFEKFGHFFTPSKLSTDLSLAYHLENKSKDFRINPGLFYGLVMTESSFNPKAYSYARALGLTQITKRAALQIQNEIDENKTNYLKHELDMKVWPLDERMESSSFLEAKFLIESGQVHDEHDWRLNPKKSLSGGIVYLNYLRNYWKNYFKEIPQYKRESIDLEKSLTNLSLASYNLGPSRVRHILQDTEYKKKHEWQKIKPYIRTVKTYCALATEITMKNNH